MARFSERVVDLPWLGIGVSTEYGVAPSPDHLDIFALRTLHPEWAGFLEIGVEVAKGFDDTALRWIDQNWAATYHFLDINLDRPQDFDTRWIRESRALIDTLDPAWVCGDAGLWHMGGRERGHMLLLPPILCDEHEKHQAEGINRLRQALGKEVLPENPPGHVFIGDLHLLDYFARTCERADTGFLLDCAHLAIYQMALGHAPLTGLDCFPLERVVELHVAGSQPGEHQGYRYAEDSHTPNVLPSTWEIFDYVVARAPNLRAVVFECERNPLTACIDGFTRISATVQRHRGGSAHS